ncbi:MAG: hypothetical protein ACOC1P_04815, partial [Minisyncoccales bacterium]
MEEKFDIFRLFLERRIVKFDVGADGQKVEESEKIIPESDKESPIRAELTKGTSELVLSPGGIWVKPEDLVNTDIGNDEYVKSSGGIWVSPESLSDPSNPERTIETVESNADVEVSDVKKSREGISDQFNSNDNQLQRNITDKFIETFHGRAIFFDKSKWKENLSRLGHGHLLSAVSSKADADLKLDEILGTHQNMFLKSFAWAGNKCNTINKFGSKEIQRWSLKKTVLEKQIIPELKLRRDDKMGALKDMERSLTDRRWKYLNPSYYSDKARNTVHSISDNWSHLRGSEKGKRQISAVATIEKALQSAKKLLTHAEK